MDVGSSFIPSTSNASIGGFRERISQEVDDRHVFWQNG
jgi:hypothetical protein